MLVGPGYADTDFGLTKNTKITERFSLVFKAELFNIFNHPNFATPSATVFNAGVHPVRAATAGQITTLVGSGGIAGVARQTQFSLKLQF